MTTKNRSKQQQSPVEKSPSAGQEDASKKSPKSGNGVGVPPAQAPASGLCSKLATALFYVALVASGGFAAFYLQRALEEVKLIGARGERSAEESHRLVTQVDGVHRQVASLSSTVGGLQAALGVARAELEDTSSRVAQGEAETTRVAEALQKLQNELLQELAEGVREVKEARERDFSSLERTVEERLAEVSRSVAASMAEFAAAQGAARSQMEALEARLGLGDDGALLRGELAAVADATATLAAAQRAADASSDSLREQIGAVSGELQTRNQEVASLAGEVEEVRRAAQEAAGALRGALADAQADVQALGGRALALEEEVQEGAGALQAVEAAVQEAEARAQRRAEETEARLKAQEEGGEALGSSLADLATRVEALLATVDAHKSSLVAQGRYEERARDALQARLEFLQASLEVPRDSLLKKQVKEVQRRLAILEETLRTEVAGLEEQEGEATEPLDAPGHTAEEEQLEGV